MPVISVSGLSKSYRLGTIGGGTLRGDFSRWWARARGLPDPALKIGQESDAHRVGQEFWALRDVSFDVQQGEILGIIGRNGAGKSTLLKILSRVTAPTAGEVRVKGRVASLLEVGTGFHPELTGRENVFLNGAILGMTKPEIRRKFDEIVDFAEIEAFIDTPVKRYSSGMHVRLAFAIAAHLEPEILILDEVLAVGDVDFQRKCLGKMSTVARAGRTVIFVSHNLAAVRGLCQRAVVLKAGSVSFSGGVGDAIECYMGRRENALHAEFAADPTRPSITSVAVDSASLANGTLSVRVGFDSPFPLLRPVPGIVICSRSGTPVFGSNSRFHGNDGLRSRLRSGVAELFVEKLAILPGSYTMSVWLGDWQSDYDHKPDALSFDFGDAKRPHTPNPEAIGYVDADAHWSIAAPCQSPTSAPEIATASAGVRAH